MFSRLGVPFKGCGRLSLVWACLFVVVVLSVRAVCPSVCLSVLSSVWSVSYTGGRGRPCAGPRKPKKGQEECWSAERGFSAFLFSRPPPLVGFAAFGWGLVAHCPRRAPGQVCWKRSPVNA